MLKQCVFCPRPSSPSCEHVLPRWLLKMFPDDEGPYGWSVNGKPVLKRDDQPRTHTSIGKVKVPVCERCNGVLNERFETPTKVLIRRIFDMDLRVRLDGPDAMKVGLWFLKTWLLLAHPRVEYSEPGIAPPRWDTITDDLWTWMVEDKAPPDGLSVWATRRAVDRNNGVVTRYLPLPTVVADGREIDFVVYQAGLRGLTVNLVYHPGWEIEHPLEVEGRALRLWSPGGPTMRANFSALPSVDPRDTSWCNGRRVDFFPGTFPKPDLPPLKPDFDWNAGLARGHFRTVQWTGEAE